jgi:threonine dehydrogenase-like Zn-dependent dehydrogenase
LGGRFPAARLFQLAGTRVIAFDVIRARCRVASEAGIETALDVPAEGQLAALRDLTRSRGVAIAVDAVGHSAVVQTCVEACTPFGQVILLGSPRAALETEIPKILRTVHYRWLTFRGAHEWRLPPCPVWEAK